MLEKVLHALKHSPRLSPASKLHYPSVYSRVVYMMGHLFEKDFNLPQGQTFWLSTDCMLHDIPE